MLTKVKYTGATPGADTNNYTLFTTVEGQIPQNFFQHVNVKRFVVSIVHSATLTLTWYESSDRGSNWRQLGTETIAAVANTDDVRDFLVEPYSDWRIILTNGGSAQSPFEVNMVMTDQRNVAV